MGAVTLRREHTGGPLLILQADDPADFSLALLAQTGQGWRMKDDVLTIKASNRTVVYKLGPIDTWTRERIGVMVYDEVLA